MILFYIERNDAYIVTVHTSLMIHVTRFEQLLLTSWTHELRNFYNINIIFMKIISAFTKHNRLKTLTQCIITREIQQYFLCEHYCKINYCISFCLVQTLFTKVHCRYINFRWNIIPVSTGGLHRSGSNAKQ